MVHWYGQSLEAHRHSLFSIRVFASMGHVSSLRRMSSTWAMISSWLNPLERMVRTSSEVRYPSSMRALILYSGESFEVSGGVWGGREFWWKMWKSLWNILWIKGIKVFWEKNLSKCNHSRIDGRSCVFWCTRHCAQIRSFYEKKSWEIRIGLWENSFLQ